MIRDAKLLEAYLGDLLNSLPDASFLVEPSGTFVLVNALMEKMLGYESTELCGKTVGTLVPERFRGVHAAHCSNYFAKPRTRAMGVDLSLRARHKDGTEVPVEISLSPIETDRGTYVLGAIRDTRQGQERYRAMFQQMAVGVLHSTSEGRPLDVNQKFCELTGYTRDEALALGARELTHPDDAAKGFEARALLLASERPAYEREVRLIRKDGSEVWTRISTTLVRGTSGEPVHFISLIYDISSHKRLEEEHDRIALRFRQVTENIQEVFWLADAATHEILYVSPAYKRVWGRDPHALQASPRDWLEAIHHEDRARVLAAAQTKQITGDYDEQYRIVRPDGSVRWIRDRAFPVREDSRVVRLAGVAEDITEQKRAADDLRESERRFSTLMQNIELISLMLDRNGAITYCNDYLLRLTGWTRDEALGQNWLEKFLPPEIREELERVHSALVADQPEAWHHENEILTRSGERRLIRWNNTVLRSLSGDVVGTASIGEDITALRRAEEAIKRNVVQLKTVFTSTVEMATMLSGLRDPYTAGHERRVGEIATAIGVELGLDLNQQEGLHVAGQLHDIGKITIPSEILNKPTKLTAIEYALIQTHAAAGYEVLKTVAFPWPVAQVALQHHERMNGSGYPQGLIGEAILLEARIMAVADVVEAMSSHRPYRPGLGIDKALAEIERGRGTLYDPNVADACLHLFREKRYELSP